LLPLRNIGHQRNSFFYFSFLILREFDTVPWNWYQPISRPLPTQDNTNVEHTQIDIHVLFGVRIHDPSIRVSEGTSCLRPLSRCNRLLSYYSYLKTIAVVKSSLSNLQSIILRKINAILPVYSHIDWFAYCATIFREYSFYYYIKLAIRITFDSIS
jgi:hypothetical protein